jgi:DNA-binding NarL/FixJ family response regulator
VRVLIVDDHPSFRGCARAVLESEGYEVVGEAANGEEAIEVAAKLHPDLVLVDIGLPDCSGFEVAERMAALDHAPAVILTSSRDRSDYGSSITDSSARGFIPKADLSVDALSLLLK